MGGGGVFFGWGFVVVEWVWGVRDVCYVGVVGVCVLVFVDFVDFGVYGGLLFGSLFF